MKSLSEFSSVHEAIEYAYTQNPKYPTKPIKPRLEQKHASGDAIIYANSLNKYEIDYEKYKLELEKYNKETAKINTAIEEYIKDASGLNTIPEQYRDKIYSYAYGQGHSSGYIEVYNELCNLVDIF